MRTVRKLLLFLFLSAACAVSKDPFVQLEAGDYSIVEVGRYPYTTRTVRDLTKLEEPVGTSLKELREKIDARLPLLAEMADSLFPDETHRLFFKYKFTSIDEERDRLIVRYFAPIPYPEIFAGYQCQFVLNLESGTLEQVFLTKIPLE